MRTSMKSMTLVTKFYNPENSYDVMTIMIRSQILNFVQSVCVKYFVKKFVVFVHIDKKKSLKIIQKFVIGA